MAFKTSNSWFEFSQADGYQFGPYQRADQMKQCLIYMNKLYTAGLIDKDYVSRDDDTIRALSAQDKIGYFHSWADTKNILTLPQSLLTGSTEEETELANIMQDVQKYVDDSLPKFVTGVMSIDKEYDGYIDKLKSMNVEKAIQIQKSKFDRWSKR